jgi:hypothetical protein
MNTISTFTYRQKYFRTTLDELLKRALIAEKICNVDNSDVKRIENPYGSAPTASVTAINGTYSVSTYTTTDDTLTVDNEVKVSEHIFSFEEIMSNFDLYADRMKEMMFAVKDKIDYFVLNNLCEDATSAYTTATGGFSTVANINKIFADLSALVAGYTDMYKGTFLVLENTEVSGVQQAQATNGFNYADAVLKNGFMSNFQGVEIYVTRTGTFVDATIGTKTVTNAGHRVFGVKNVATYASPRGVQYDEKKVSGKTGMELLVVGLIGFKLWATKSALIVDITLA